VRSLKQTKSVRPNRRKKQKQPLPWKQVLARLLRVTVFCGSATFLLFGAVLGGRLLLGSGYFAVTTVRVENNQRLLQEEVLALSDIQQGSNIFDLDLDMIGGKIEENPWVASARVERVFPNEVTIRIEERQPQAIVRLGTLYYVDVYGEIFKMLDAGDRLDYPLISGIDRQLLLDKPEQARELLLGALGLLTELAERRVFNLDQVSELRVAPQEGITLYTYRGGVPVRFGQNGYRTKLDRLERIYRELQPRLAAIDYIDLNVVERVIVKLESHRNRGQG
jgi:cell division protein FtsQ